MIPDVVDVGIPNGQPDRIEGNFQAASSFVSQLNLNQPTLVNN